MERKRSTRSRRPRQSSNRNSSRSNNQRDSRSSSRKQKSSSHKHSGRVIIQHRRDNRSQNRFWDFIEFGVPLIIISAFVFPVLNVVADLSNPFVGLIGFALCIYLAVLASKKVRRFFNKISDYLNRD